MNFKITERLLDAIKPYTENCKIEISVSNKDWRGREYKSDFVTIDEKNDVCFEVFDNEIIVYYFTDHYHFEDYTSDLEDGEDDFTKRAEDFLLELFQYSIRHIEYYKGSTLSSEKYYVVYNDGREDNYIGGTWFGLSKLINPFGKKTSKSTTWIFNKSKGTFENRYPKNPAPEAIEVIDIDDDCYIEIFENDNTYSYIIMEIDYDDYNGIYFWAPSFNGDSGLYDTKEKAIEYAMHEIEKREKLKKQQT